MKKDLLWRKKMASCFEFRLRTSSFDLHQLAHKKKLTKISKVFRSHSFTNVASDSPKASPKASPKSSPKGSPTAQVARRRFMRVVKDGEKAGEEYENPHLIRRYTQEYVKEQWSQRTSASLDEQSLPYVVSGHTILKKHQSVDSPPGSGNQSPTQSKHASFKEEVQIIEFDKKGKIEKCQCFRHIEKLQDFGDECALDLCDVCQSKGIPVEDCPHLSDSDQSDADEVLGTVTKNISKLTVCNESIELTDTESGCTVDSTKDETSVEVHTSQVHQKEGSPDSIVDKLVSVHSDITNPEVISNGHSPH